MRAASSRRQFRDVAESYRPGPLLQLVSSRCRTAEDDRIGTADGAAPSAETVSSDALFASLDGRRLRTRHGQVTIHVSGVLQEGGCQWAQLVLTGLDAPRMMTMRLRRGASVQRVLLVVASWLANRVELADVVHVS